MMMMSLSPIGGGQTLSSTASIEELQQSLMPSRQVTNLQGRQGAATSKQVVMHIAMYCMSMYGELNELRNQQSGQHQKVYYYSQIMAQIQIFVEFLFEMLGEKSEPLILGIELIKCAMKLNEYTKLVKNEKIKTYLELDDYRGLAQIRLNQSKMIKMGRSQKQLDKPSNTCISSNLNFLRNNKTKPTHQRLKQETEIIQEEPECDEETGNEAVRQRNSSSILVANNSSQSVQSGQKSSGFITNMFRALARLIYSSKYKLDDLISIFRPVIYIFSIIKYGKKSYKPLKISLALDIIQITCSSIRVFRDQQVRQAQEQGINLTRKMKSLMLDPIERGELVRRSMRSLVKYLVRDPIFQQYFIPGTLKVLRACRIPHALIQYLFAYINFFRYYAYVS